MGVNSRKIFLHYVASPLTYINIIFLTVFLNLFSLFSPTALRDVSAAALPEDYVGLWSGIDGVQVNPSRTFTMRFALVSGEVGQVIGTFEYPSLSCGGKLILENVSGDVIELSENLLYGSCIMNGTAFLSIAENNTLMYQWETNNAPTTATGTMAKTNITGDAINAAYIGVWQGQGQGGNSNYTILATITPSANNSAIGAITYPSLGCGGVWSIQTAASQSLAILEDLDYGLGMCIDSGVVTLTPNTDGSLRYEWRTPGRTDIGKLTRVSGNQIFLPLLSQ